MQTQPFDLASPDGTTLRGRRWLSDDVPVRAVLIIAHGMAEHGDRYARFAEAAANVLTNPQLDPFGKIPEFKFCAARLERLELPAAAE